MEVVCGESGGCCCLMVSSIENSEIESRYVEFRAEGNSISGTVIKYGDIAKYGSFSESFEPGSVSISNNAIVNLQHNRGSPVARVGSGLTFVETDESIDALIDLPDTRYAAEAKELIDANILRGFSIEFGPRLVTQDRWVGKHRSILKTTLLGFSLVDTPAYPESTIAKRFADLLDIRNVKPTVIRLRAF